MKITQKHILYASILLNVLLISWIVYITRTDKEAMEELYQSKGRVEVLEKTVDALSLKGDSLENVRDSIQALLIKKPKERVVIIKEYDKRIEDVNNLSIDSSIRYLAERLSEIGSD